MPRHILYIINPISGTRKKGALRELIESKTKAAGIPFTIEHSVASGDYSFLHSLLQRQGITDIVIAAGDGTVNQVIDALKDFPVQFGILPCGSGNGLAFSAGIPRDLEKALDIVFAGTPQKTDGFLVNGKFACMLCGIGFDAQVAHDFANDPRRGLSTYIRMTVSHFFSAAAYPFTIEANGIVLEKEAFFISIANSNQFGNNFTIAPQASLTDGMLDIVIVTKQHKLSVLLQTLRQVGGFNQLIQKELAKANTGVLYFHTDKLRISNPGKAPIHIDGDPAPTTEQLDIQVLNHAFRLICP
jgi:YegS/Rv2252/BmrU family lipid kinase